MIPFIIPKVNRKKINNKELIKLYLIQKKFFNAIEYKINIIIEIKIISAAGVCFERKAIPKSRGNNIKYIFFSSLTDKIKK